MQRRSRRKRWADDRVDEQTWEYLTSANGADKCTIQRDQRLYFLPKAETWANNNIAQVRYEMPTGNIERITFDYEVVIAGGETWTFSLYDVDNASTEWSVVATSAGSVDLDSTNDYAATTKFAFRLQNTSGGNQTPASDGSTNFKITNLMVYGEDETGAGIDLDSIATDIITDFSDVLNSDTSYLDASSNSRTVEPFITEGDNCEALGDILMRMAGFGNSNDERYAVGLLHSEKAATPNGLPVLYTQEYPDIDAGYDYFISLEDANVMGPVSLTRDYASIINTVTVTYRDERGWQQIVTSSDDAGLVDSTSVTAYGTRPAHLNVGNSIATRAADYGTRYVQRYKDPQWIINGSIGVMGAIEGASGEQVPASRVEAGKRLKIDNYDTFIISRTRYDADSETVEISVGNPDLMVFTETVFDPVWNDPIPGDGDSGGASGVELPDRLGMRDLKKSNRAEYIRRKKLILQYRRQHGGSLKQAKRALGF